MPEAFSAQAHAGAGSRPHARRILAGVGARLVLALVALLPAGCTVHERFVRHEVTRQYSVEDPQFRRTMASLFGPGIVGGNRVRTLVNGDEIFPSMLEAIASARSTVDFETYIYWSGEIGRRFAEALAERARAGVQVNVLLDWLGSARIEDEILTTLRESGVEVRRYHPLRWYTLQRLNNRTHRKLLVVDGRVGFTGGVGIADEWTGNAQDPDHWRDTHFRVEGPVVAQMQAVFLDNWIKVSGRVLHDQRYFPPTEDVGETAAQMFSSSPTGGAASMRLMYLIAITAASHSIQLSSAYFLPDALARDALIAAAQRGVRVQIITPGKWMDVETVRRASRARWGDLLEAGIEIYEYQPTMFHCKSLVVDGIFASVGSTNFDPRSFGLNDEANLNVYDAEFARRQSELFEEDLKKSRRITYEAWRNRPWTSKVWEHAASLLGPFL